MAVPSPGFLLPFLSKGDCSLICVSVGDVCGGASGEQERGIGSSGAHDCDVSVTFNSIFLHPLAQLLTLS